MFGDADDGYVLDLGGREDAARSWLSVGAALFGRDDFKELSGGLSEAVFWLLGETGCGVFERLADSSVKASLASRALPHSGYYLLQAGRRGGPEAISVGFDCGELGFGALAAHGHADALSVTLRVGGSDILVDPGTYDYFTYPEWRCYFRGTRAHNTVVIDEQDQSEMLGPFLWGQRANCRCVQWSPNQQGGTVVGEHDGYGRLPGGVRHRRTVTLDAGAGQVCVTDFLTGGREHSAGLYWHLSDDCQVRRVSEHVFEVHGGGCVVVIELDERLSVRVLCGSQEPKGGWVSRGYHRKWPATTLLGCCQWREQLTLASRIRVE